MDIPLKSLKFLALDCQATSNSPKKGHLLEIGWLLFGADALCEPTKFAPITFFVRPPEGFVLPARITKLTGIFSTHFSQAVSETAIFKALNDQIGIVANSNQGQLCPAVIHFARYEISWLKHLYRIHDKVQPLPFEVLCTHQIASRVFPQLPRKGLRAVAGYLGCSVPPLKRCAAHLGATAYIWCKLIEKLAEVADIHTLGQLQDWLTKTKITSEKKSYPMPREFRLKLPCGPGIYHMTRSNGDILYIGKATSLKQRVNSYFQSSRHHSDKTLEMLSQAMGVTFTDTPTALEAALLETDAIKQYHPPYNIALTNDHRSLAFVSRDFGLNAPNNNTTCRLGPVPDVGPFIAAHAMEQHMKNRRKTLDISETLSIPSNYCPDDNCFHSGVAMFRKKFSGVFRTKANRLAILHIGRLSWLRRMADKATPVSEDIDETQEPKAPTAFVWTPEAVTDTLESICRRCGFLLRRARWLSILSESTVVWKVADDNADRINIIQLKKGKVSTRYEAHLLEPIPLPQNHREPYDIRQMHLNLETYDRLRVLTTEMRRLISHNRLVCIRLGEKVFLYPGQLRTLFKWI